MSCESYAKSLNHTLNRANLTQNRANLTLNLTLHRANLTLNRANLTLNLLLNLTLNRASLTLLFSGGPQSCYPWSLPNQAQAATGQNSERPLAPEIQEILRNPRTS